MTSLASQPLPSSHQMISALWLRSTPPAVMLGLRGRLEEVQTSRPHRPRSGAGGCGGRQKKRTVGHLRSATRPPDSRDRDVDADISG
jgi:hypothetical protein